MPGRAAIIRKLNSRHYAARISGCTGDGAGSPSLQSAGNRVDGRDRSHGIGRLSGSNQAGLQRLRLHAHIGKQVHRGLLHIDIRKRAINGRAQRVVMIVIKAKGPLHCS